MNSLFCVPLWAAICALPATSRAERAPRAGDTVIPSVAARARMSVAGDELEFPEKVHFAYNAVAFAPGADEVLERIAVALQASPEVQRLWIEGHTDQSGRPRQNQALSEARAAAVRSALVQKGVAPERLVAYGFGESRPAVAAPGPARRQEKNRRVVFRLVTADRPALASRRPVEFGKAAVVGLQGSARFTVGSADDEAAYQPLKFRTELPEGAIVETGDAGRALLRLPDLSRVLMEPKTRLVLAKVFHRPDDTQSYTSVRVERGAISVAANPGEKGFAPSIWSYSGGSVSARTATFDLRVAPGGATVSLWTGAADVAAGGSASVPLTAGQALEPTESVSRTLLPAPVALEPLDAPCPLTTLRWQGVEGADRYRVEVAEDLAFYQPARVDLVEGESHGPDGLDATRRWFWRVRALDADGRLGRPSAIHACRVQTPPTSVARREPD